MIAPVIPVTHRNAMTLLLKRYDDVQSHVQWNNSHTHIDTINIVHKQAYGLALRTSVCKIIRVISMSISNMQHQRDLNAYFVLWLMCDLCKLSWYNYIFELSEVK